MLKYIILFNSFVPWILLILIIGNKNLLSKIEYKINYIIYFNKKDKIDKYKDQIIEESKENEGGN